MTICISPKFNKGIYFESIFGSFNQNDIAIPYLKFYLPGFSVNLELSDIAFNVWLSVLI